MVFLEIFPDPMIGLGQCPNESVLHLALVVQFDGLSIISDRRLLELGRLPGEAITRNIRDLLAPESGNGARWGAVLR